MVKPSLLCLSSRTMCSSPNLPGGLQGTRMTLFTSPAVAKKVTGPGEAKKREHAGASSCYLHFTYSLIEPSKQPAHKPFDQALRLRKMYTKLWCYPTSLALNMDCPINSKLISLDLLWQEHTEFLTSANTTTASSVISQRIIRTKFPPSIKLFCILSLFELNSSSIYLIFQSCLFHIQHLSHLSTIPVKEIP